MARDARCGGWLGTPIAKGLTSSLPSTRTMRTALTTLLACTCAAFGINAYAAADAASAPLTRQEAKDLKTESDAAYKARKKVAEANQDLNKADCEVTADGSTERACKKDARAQKNKDKADAKVIHEAEKDAIKAQSK